ncbi:MAG: DNA alkylation repair protein [Flammeovirgaceae bacterium]|nr:DNA alkylation repair protein [Flammeovirgaceae bacterium]
MRDFIASLSAEFKRHANPKIAEGQKAYMKDHFEFYGIKAPVRREIQKPFLVRNFLPPKEKLEGLTKKLWEMNEREYQLFGQELVSKYSKNFSEDDIILLEYMVTHKSWWDTVDFIASHLIGEYFKLYPRLRKKKTREWLASDNIWLQRSALLFQLNYKDKLDTDLLESIIKPLLGSKEFFINKAIGWMLRQYSRTNSQWVLSYVNRTPLHSLSRREALRLIK